MHACDAFVLTNCIHIFYCWPIQYGMLEHKYTRSQPLVPCPGINYDESLIATGQRKKNYRMRVCCIIWDHGTYTKCIFKTRCISIRRTCRKINVIWNPKGYSTSYCENKYLTKFTSIIICIIIHNSI